ncbi:response regulator [Xylophilus rhododendri]|uniref:Response regulator n=1 Tax=Xylophilus rhododendri TaxID=2697032 RepID=A0A857J6L8_9BURK|nr:response regulator [Xylophilus rhododendri]QHI98729.1 response regulator [Xylophilus rhododendri]
MLSAFLVEDNPLIRENLSAALTELAPVQMLGWAAGEEAARQWFAAHDDWHLAIVDLFLEDGNGLGVLRALQARDEPRQHVVVLTNYATPDIRKRCTDLGADAVFDKSSEIEALAQYCDELAQASS